MNISMIVLSIKKITLARPLTDGLKSRNIGKENQDI